MFVVALSDYIWAHPPSAPSSACTTPAGLALLSLVASHQFPTVCTLLVLTLNPLHLSSSALRSVTHKAHLTFTQLTASQHSVVSHRLQSSITFRWTIYTGFTFYARAILTHKWTRQFCVFKNGGRAHSHGAECPCFFCPVIRYGYAMYHLQHIYSTKGSFATGSTSTFLKWVSHAFPTMVSSVYI